MTQLDHAFGKLMKTLDEQKLTDTTFVVFTSDNGPEGDGTEGSDSRQHRRAAGPEAVDVRRGHPRARDRPLAGADSARNDLSDAPIIGSDLFPTILGICGSEGAGRPGDRRGRCAAGAARQSGRHGGPAEGAAVLAAEHGPAEGESAHGSPRRRLETARIAGLHPLELYNLKIDPREKTDLKEKEPERFFALRKRLEKLNAEIEKEGPDWWRRLSPDGGGPLPKP